MTLDRFIDVDLTTALSTLHHLALKEGDLGRDYWTQISELLKDAASFKQRALVAEEKLRLNRQRAASSRNEGGGPRISTKERRRIASEYPRDIARMQKTLISAGKDYQVDEMIQAWNEHSSQMGAVWTRLPKSNDELLLKLLSALES
ncbi:hypothetical protein [Herbaspirillum robiniae]|uniref:Uncharacterized protein n=1 Tax=Herbaspirillum robiniae TaxID=2014887 RepID=A0ABX2M2E7_9BURK|nr:hypothetical protein [Herbaspirillum robiniae]NUU04133.1 hypothetical protein [Herbaspirillum robiniae]